MTSNTDRLLTMTITQLTELIKHVEEEHNFFNRKSGQRIVKSITPHINLRVAGTVTSVDINGYGWEKSFCSNNDGNKMSASVFDVVMTFLDTTNEE
jgi:hypothetical protein